MQEVFPTFDGLWAENLLQSALESSSQNSEAQNHLQEGPTYQPGEFEL